MGISVDDFILTNCHLSGEAIARQIGKDPANVRKRIRKLRTIHRDLPWYEDVRQTPLKEQVSGGGYRPVSPREGVEVPVTLEVVAGDFHVPYHDHAAVACLLGYLRDARPDGLTINGDFLDFYALSRFSKDPERELLLQDELDEANALLDSIDAVLPQGAVKRFVVGNHEVRLQTYLRDNARALHGLRALSLDALLNLAERGYILVPMVGRDASVRIGEVEVGHFNIARKDSGASARALLLDRGCSVIQSHTHKLAAIYKRAKGTGEQRAAWEIGCMCQLSPEYVASPDWQNGFATITRVEGGSRYHVALKEIIGGELLAAGRRY